MRTGVDGVGDNMKGYCKIPLENWKRFNTVVKDLDKSNIPFVVSYQEDGSWKAMTKTQDRKKKDIGWQNMKGPVAIIHYGDEYA
jgi:hypothetical protein